MTLDSLSCLCLIAFRAPSAYKKHHEGNRVRFPRPLFHWLCQQVFVAPGSGANRPRLFGHHRGIPARPRHTILLSGICHPGLRALAGRIDSPPRTRPQPRSCRVAAPNSGTDPARKGHHRQGLSVPGKDRNPIVHQRRSSVGRRCRAGKLALRKTWRRPNSMLARQSI